MTSRKLIELLNRSHFRPFVLHLGDASQLSVDHPWQISTAPNQAEATWYDTDDERTIVVILRNVSHISFDPESKLDASEGV